MSNRATITIGHDTIEATIDDENRVILAKNRARIGEGKWDGARIVECDASLDDDEEVSERAYSELEREIQAAFRGSFTGSVCAIFRSEKLKRYLAVYPIGALRAGESARLVVYLHDSSIDDALGEVEIESFDGVSAARVVKARIVVECRGSSYGKIFEEQIAAAPSFCSSPCQLFLDEPIADNAEGVTVAVELMLDGRQVAVFSKEFPVEKTMLEPQAPPLTIRVSARKADLHWLIHIPLQLQRDCVGLHSKTSGWTSMASTDRKRLLRLLDGAIGHAADDEQGMLRVNAVGRQLYGYWPDFLKQSYAALRVACGEDFEIQLICDGPFVPWEYTRPNEADAVLCLAHPVARFSPQDEYLAGIEVIRPGIVCAVKPEYDEAPLPYASLELDAAVGSYDVVRLPARLADWRAVLRGDHTRGPVSLLYFLGHGGFDRSTSCAFVWLEDGKAYAIDACGEDLNRRNACGTVVLLNSCVSGKQGEGRDEFGGWPRALMDRGFGGLLAPLYDVVDKYSAAFAVQLLAGLFQQDRPIGRAILDARITLLSDTIGVLSYLYYGNVLTRFG
jgi:hypothetical protein